jgi:hypothetical protein
MPDGHPDHINVLAAAPGHLGADVGRNRHLQTWLCKEQEREIQQAPREQGSSMSMAVAAGGQPGSGSSERLPAALVMQCPPRLLPWVKALGGAGAVSRSGRT